MLTSNKWISLVQVNKERDFTYGDTGGTRGKKINMLLNFLTYHWILLLVDNHIGAVTVVTH